MRSWWPIPAQELDNLALLGEHNEIYIMGRTIAGLNKGFYLIHPETKRWQGHSIAMWLRHEELAAEMVRRGMNHKSPWPMEFVKEDEDQYPGLIEPLHIMQDKLKNKIHRREHHIGE